MDYYIDTGLLASNLLPPDKRTTTMTYWMKALLSAMSWLNNIALVYYLDATGLLYTNFTPGASYAPGENVLYQHAVYQRVYPAGNMPMGTLPTDPNYFVPVLPAPGLIGVNERILYSGNTLTLTWALNKYFGTVFRQPASYLGQSPLSDIYIQNFDSSAQSFITGASEVDSSAVGAIISSGYVLNELTSDPLADFAIYIPALTFSEIIGGQQTIRAFANRYVIAGINYAIHIY